MNQYSFSNSSSTSTQKWVLAGALIAFIPAVLVLGWFVFRDSHRPASMPSTKPVEFSEVNNEPAPSLEAALAKGFDLLIKKKDARGALASFEQCVRDFPDHGESWHGLALAQRETGNALLSIANHDRAIELTPTRADYYFARGMTYNRLKKYDAAIKDFQLGLEQKPIACLAPGMLNMGMGLAYRGKGDLKKALECADQAIALNSGNKWFHDERVKIEQALGDQERVNAYFKKEAESSVDQ